MGTRNLTCVVKDGDYKIAQYCQWDGYLTGQGKTIAAFIVDHLQDDESLATFNALVASVEEADEEEIRKLWKSLGADNSGFVTMDISDKFREKYPQFHGDCGASILEMIFSKNEPGFKVQKTLNFAKDSLFCEFCYVLDLDTNMLEIYKGFVTEPLGEDERFFKLFGNDEYEAVDETKYYPVKLFKAIPFSEVTKTTMEELDGSDEEDEED